MTGRINSAVVSLLAGRQSKERLRLIDARSPIASTYLGTAQQITWLSMSDMTVLSTKTR